MILKNEILYNKIIKTAIQDLISNKVVRKSNYELVSTANNLVVKIDNKFLKIYILGNSTIKDNELLLYSKTKQPELYKKMLFFNKVIVGNNTYNYALFETIEGKTIDEIDYTKDKKNIAKTIFNYIQDVGQIKCTGFGSIDSNLQGNYSNFSEFIFDFVHGTSTTLYMEPSTRSYVKLLYELLVDNVNLIKAEKPRLIPVDLNFKNIMITNNGKIIIIDPGALLSGPVEMVYGEVMAHSYGTEIYKEFKKYIGNVNESVLRLFAILSSINVLAFIIKLGLDPSQAKPFGNSYNFFDLIGEHLTYLK